MKSLKDVVDLIEKAIIEDPSPNLKEGGIIKDGYSKELDELREIKKEHEDFIRSLDERERRRTGIEKLKLGYNSVMGYYHTSPRKPRPSGRDELAKAFYILPHILLFR